MKLLPGSPTWGWRLQRRHRGRHNPTSREGHRSARSELGAQLGTLKNGDYVGSEVTPSYLMSLISMLFNSLSDDQTTVTVCQPRVTVIVSPIESVELDD